MVQSVSDGMYNRRELMWTKKSSASALNCFENGSFSLGGDCCVMEWLGNCVA